MLSVNVKPAVMSLQGSSSTWPCSATGCGGGSGPSGSWRWRISTTTETVSAAAAAAASPPQASSPGPTLWTTATPASTQPDTRRHARTPPTLTSRSLTRTWARAPTTTCSSRTSRFPTWRFDPEGRRNLLTGSRPTGGERTASGRLGESSRQRAALTAESNCSGASSSHNNKPSRWTRRANKLSL